MLNLAHDLLSALIQRLKQEKLVEMEEKIIKGVILKKGNSNLVFCDICP